MKLSCVEVMEVDFDAELRKKLIVRLRLDDYRYRGGGGQRAHPVGG